MVNKFLTFPTLRVFAVPALLIKANRLIVAFDKMAVCWVYSQLVFVYSESLQEKENLYKSWSRKLYNFNCAGLKSPNSAAVPGISIAMDSRLENGIEMSAELRLRVRTCLLISLSCTFVFIN